MPLKERKNFSVSSHKDYVSAQTKFPFRQKLLEPQLERVFTTLAFYWMDLGCRDLISFIKRPKFKKGCQKNRPESSSDGRNRSVLQK